ncbi:Uncharacterised protein [Legionella hackeliae]|nr:hypothetical protein Lhac_0966 [Legionella hackeliae]STX48366.1 Uncharacterised protein [Legionella hackeliae]
MTQAIVNVLTRIKLRKTNPNWGVETISCWDEHVAAYDDELLYRHAVNSVKSETLDDDYLASSGLQVAI